MEASEYRPPVRPAAAWLGDIVPGSAAAAVLGFDVINHPPHYTKGTIEVIDAIEGMGLADDYHLAAAVKYIARCRHKGNQRQDIEKAIWYLERKLRKA